MWVLQMRNQNNTVRSVGKKCSEKLKTLDVDWNWIGLKMRRWKDQKDHNGEFVYFCNNPHRCGLIIYRAKTKGGRPSIRVSSHGVMLFIFLSVPSTVRPRSLPSGRTTAAGPCRRSSPDYTWGRTRLPKKRSSTSSRATASPTLFASGRITRRTSSSPTSNNTSSKIALFYYQFMVFTLSNCV